MKYLTLSLIVLLLAGSLFAQKPYRRKAVKTTPMQGICGTVVLKQGNFMPSPDRPARTGQLVEREVLVFPLLNKSQVDSSEDGFVSSVRETKPVKTIKSDKNGKFCVRLPIGKYSVLVREPKGLYANLYDDQNNIFPVVVQKNRQSDVRVEITHQAVF
ncbi:hypothetical protein [Spirosoma validum]|uniref:Carboxypeptidase regulatory-like domain-containing protein n=1 Tax=Spirosoma validum TaxID=2771355 RepID=A0A927B3U0_9BACT|nr:hypothetical protein [Spirosoma validum]MBD2754707.1 hypothetical protein [Spirosoma validum]